MTMILNWLYDMAVGFVGLQHFADPNVQTTGSAELAGENKTFYHDTLIDSAEPNLVHANYGLKIAVPEHAGKSMELRVFDVLDKQTRELQEGVTPDGNNLKMRTMTVELKQYGDYVTLSDVATVTMIDPLVLQATKAMGSQAGRSLDTVVRDVITAGTNVLYAPKVVDGTATEVTSRANLTADCKITPDLIFQAAAQLKTMLAEPIGSSYIALIHPMNSYEIMSNEMFQEMHKYSAVENLFANEIGRIGNVRFIESSECKVVKGGSGGNLGIFLTMVLGKDAYAVTEINGLGLEHIFKPLGSAGSADPLSQRATCGWKSTIGCIRVKEQNMIRIESCGRFSTKVEAN